LLQVDTNGATGGENYQTLMTLQDVTAASLVAGNFLPGFNPDGSGVTGSTIQGSSSDDTLVGSIGDDQLFGNDGNDSLSGGNGNDLLSGGDQNDQLDGGQGRDTYDGGAGNDTLIYDPVDLLGSSSVVYDGGSGVDTLKFNGAGQALDLTTVEQTKIAGIENIDLTGNGNNSLALNIADVINLSNESDQLLIKGNAGDSVTSTGQGWTQGSNVNIDGQDYASYTAVVGPSTATLLVDTDINQNIS
jgi:Ca2+-binding RTX toxin-like protein